MTMPQHRPRIEELDYGHGTMLVCELDDQAWPCDHERDLTREEPRMSTTPIHEDGDLLTPREVAELFHVDPKTVVRWTLDGKIVSELRTLGGHRRYRYSDVLAAMDAAGKR